MIIPVNDQAPPGIVDIFAWGEHMHHIRVGDCLVVRQFTQHGFIRCPPGIGETEGQEI